MTAATPSTDRPSRSSSRDDPAAIDEHTLATPAFPFDAGPYERFPAPLGRTDADLGHVRRRAVVAVMIAWVPLVVLATAEGLAIGRNPRESFLLDVAVHARYLVALPLLIIAEYVALPKLGVIVRHFIASGLVPAGEHARYAALMESSRRLLSSPLVAVVILVLAYASTLRLSDLVHPTSIDTWLAPIVDGVRTTSLAGKWRIFVSQPLYVTVLGLWVWRAVVWGRFLYKATRLDLRLIAPHPDHMGGLRFVNASARAFPMVAFAIATGVAGNVAQRVLIDRQSVTDYLQSIVMTIVLTIAMFMGPLFALQGPLRRLRTVGMMRYGALATDLGARFERQWLRSGEAVTDDSLHASDFSAVADLNAIAANVADIRFVPIDMRGAERLILATCLPFVPLALAIMPFAEILKFAASVLL